MRARFSLGLSVTMIAAAALAGCGHHVPPKPKTPSSGQAMKAAPAGRLRHAASPESWPVYGLNDAHDAVFKGDGAKAAQWVFKVPGAVPASMSAKAVRKTYGSPTTVRDLVGIPVGVSVVQGTVYVPDDNGYLYALDAQNGHLQWQFDALNEIMTTPIVAGRAGHRLVYVGAGNSDFSYSEAARFAHPHAAIVRGTDLSAIYAINAATGRLAWMFRTKGEDMPTPAYVHGTIVFGNGDGHIYGLNAQNGKLLWKRPIRSFVSMSSATRDHGLVIMAGTHPNAIYAIDARTGHLRWKRTPPKVFSSSMGDCAPAVAHGIVVTQYEARAGQDRARSVEVGLNARTGHIRWRRNLGAGAVPPRNKDAVPMIAGRTVYTGSPVTATAYALNVKNGRILWRTPLKVRMKAAPTVYGKDVIYPTANGTLFVLNRKTGRIVNTVQTGHGGFGPQQGVIIGKTFFIGSNFGWVYAWPIGNLLKPEAKSAT